MNMLQAESVLLGSRRIGHFDLMVKLRNMKTNVVDTECMSRNKTLVFHLESPEQQKSIPFSVILRLLRILRLLTIAKRRKALLILTSRRLRSFSTGSSGSLCSSRNPFINPSYWLVRNVVLGSKKIASDPDYRSLGLPKRSRITTGGYERQPQ